ncbi:MAG TPA: hypothetical protein DEP85_04855 [Holosporales bacterium]|nr:hypothetical protein [Holosporales bacterium]
MSKCAICQKETNIGSMQFVFPDDSPLGFCLADKEEVSKAIINDSSELEERYICDECLTASV